MASLWFVQVSVLSLRPLDKEVALPYQKLRHFKGIDVVCPLGLFGRAGQSSLVGPKSFFARLRTRHFESLPNQKTNYRF